MHADYHNLAPRQILSDESLQCFGICIIANLFCMGISYKEQPSRLCMLCLWVFWRWIFSLRAVFFFAISWIWYSNGSSPLVYSNSPSITTQKSTISLVSELRLHHLFVVWPQEKSRPISNALGQAGDYWFSYGWFCCWVNNLGGMDITQGAGGSD